MRTFTFAALLAGALLCLPASLYSQTLPAASGPSPLDVERITADLASGDWILQARAINLMVRWNLKEAPGLLAGVVDSKEKPWVRGRALVALARLKASQAADKAAAAAGDSEPAMRAAAMEALSALGGSRGLSLVQAGLADKSPVVRNAAIVAFARMQRAAAWKTVAPLAAGDDAAQLAAVAKALVYIDSAESRAKLLELLRHKTPAVRAAAAEALADVPTPQAVAALLDAAVGDSTGDVRDAARASLAAQEPATLAGPLLKALESDQPAVQAAAMSLLAERPSDAACRGVAALIAKPSDKYKPILAAAIAMLSRSSSPDAYKDTFITYLTADAAEIRRAAVGAVVRCPSLDPWETLRVCLRDEAGFVRGAALTALREAKTTPPGGVVAYLGDLLGREGVDWHAPALALLSARMTPQEFPAALKATAPMLSGTGDGRGKVARALAAAADDEQKRQIAAAQGYVTRWMLLGPYDDRPESPLAVVYPPEASVDFTRTYEPYRLWGGAEFKIVAAAVCGGQEKRAVQLRPPTALADHSSSIHATFVVDVPADAKLQASLGLLDTADSEAGGRLMLAVDGRQQAELRAEKPDGWHDTEVSLAAWGGKRVAIDVQYETAGKAQNCTAAFVGAVSAGGKIAADLVEAAKGVPVQSSIGEKAPELAWVYYQAESVDGVVPMNDIVDRSANSLAYAVAQIDSPADATVVLNVDVDESFRLWLNGQKVGEKLKAEPTRLTVQLKKGRNQLLLKTGNVKDRWRFSIRITDDKGIAVAGLTEPLKPAAAAASTRPSTRPAE